MFQFLWLLVMVLMKYELIFQIISDSHPHIKSMLATIPWMRSLVSTATSRVSHVSQANGFWHRTPGLGNITTGHTNQEQEKRNTHLLKSLSLFGSIWLQCYTHEISLLWREKGSEKAALSMVYWSHLLEKWVITEIDNRNSCMRLHFWLD